MHIEAYKEYLNGVVEDYISMRPHNTDYYIEFLHDIAMAKTVEQLELYCKIVDGWLDY